MKHRKHRLTDEQDGRSWRLGLRARLALLAGLGVALFLGALAVYAAWNDPAPLVVDAAGDVGSFTSLAVVNGNPAISYRDATNLDLKYVRATDATGSAWGSPVTISDPQTNVGEFTSLAVVNGNPAISYWSSSGLRYVRANDADGNTWGSPISIDTTGDVGLYTSLAVVNGNPAISYYDETNGNLKYVRANDADGSSWGSPISIDTTGDVGRFTSLAVVNGNPAISYYDLTNGQLKYVRANDADGSSWGSLVIVDTTSSDDVGQHISLAVVNGSPAISYYDAWNGRLLYVRANDANGSSWGGPLIVDGAAIVGWFTSLAVVNGNPAISYYDITNGDLKYVRATDANGSAWDSPASIDTGGNVGKSTSLEVVNGNPAISYYDVTNGDLKYVREGNPPPCYNFEPPATVGLEDVIAVAVRWRLTAADPDPDNDGNTPNYEAQYDVAPEPPDGIITILDIMTVQAHWGEVCP